MPFPSNPENLQEVQVNGIIYIWNSTKGAWRRKPGVELGNSMNDDQVFNGNIIANSGSRATSTITGAIQVTRGGGIGVTGNVFADAFYSDNYRYANGSPLIISTSSTANIANIANIANYANTSNVANIAYYSFYSNVSNNLEGGEAGQLVYQIAANTTGFVTNGDYGKILASNGPGNMPIWVTLEELAAMNGSPFISQIIYPDGGITAPSTGNETIYLLGRGFQPGFNLTVNNQPVISATYYTSSNVSFITSNTAPGLYPVTITNPNRKYYTYEYIEFAGPSDLRFLNPPGYLNFVAENRTFNQFILVAGGYPPYNFQISAGALPGNMTIDAGSGLISGTAPDVDNPTSFFFTVQVTDAAATVITRQFYILVTVPLILRNQMTLSSVGSNYLRASKADANLSLPRTMTLSSAGSDFMRAADADANLSLPRTMTLSSAGSDFMRAADADANLSLPRTMTLSSGYWSPVIITTPTVGDSLGGGTYIGTTTDTNGVTYNLILSPYSTDTDRLAGGSWPQLNKSILGTSDVDGHFNTEYIPTTPNNASGYAADYFRDLTYGGYSDWYWPSKQEITTLSSALTSGLLSSEEKGPYLDSFRYWSSTTSLTTSFNPTTFTYYAWAMDSNTSHTIFRPRSDGTGGAMSNGRVRAVRRQLP